MQAPHPVSYPVPYTFHADAPTAVSHFKSFESRDHTVHCFLFSHNPGHGAKGPVDAW